MTSPTVIAAGHLCLDILPQLEHPITLTPGYLFEIGPATFAPGGGAANVGLSLYKLGLNVTVMAKIGQDALGGLLTQLLKAQSPDLTRHLILDSQHATSYTLVINPPEIDRCFLHHAGCNTTFDTQDVDMEAVAKAQVFYFGYPTILERFYQDEGEVLKELFQKAKAQGVTTVLDVSMPDPDTAGHAPWDDILHKTLPYVDIFVPNIEEIQAMLMLGLAEVPELLTTFLNQGCALAGLKLGAEGLYLRSGSAERLAQAGPLCRHLKAHHEAFAPVFEVDVAGTTGAGDATLAGMMSALSRGASLVDTTTFAAAVGACAVEGSDATSGIQPAEQVLARIAQGWPRAATLPYWPVSTTHPQTYWRTL